MRNPRNLWTQRCLNSLLRLLMALFYHINYGPGSASSITITNTPLKLFKTKTAAEHGCFRNKRSGP